MLTFSQILDEIELLMTIIFLFNYCLIAYNRYKQLYGFIDLCTERKRNQGHVIAMTTAMLVLFIVDSLRLIVALLNPYSIPSYYIKITFIFLEWIISLVFTILVIMFLHTKNQLDSNKYLGQKRLRVSKIQLYRLQVAGFLSLLEIGITCARILIS